MLEEVGEEEAAEAEHVAREEGHLALAAGVVDTNRFLGRQPRGAHRVEGAEVLVCLVGHATGLNHHLDHRVQPLQSPETGLRHLPRADKKKGSVNCVHH